MTALLRCAIFLGLCSVSFAQHTPRPCADFPIKTIDGKTIRISKYHGKVVMIVMFLTTCNDCLATLQLLGRLQNEMGPRGLQVIAVSLDENAAVVTPFAERYRFPFPVGHLDKEGAIELGNMKKESHPFVPYLMFVDWMGNIRFQYQGNDQMWGKGEQNIRGIATGLLRQAAEKTGPVYKTKPADK